MLLWTLTNYLRSELYYNRYQFYEGIQIAAGKGDVQMVKWVFDHFTGCQVPSEAITAAAHKGHLPVLKFLLENDVGRNCKHKLKKVELESNEWMDSVPVMQANWSGPGNVVRWGGDAIHSAVAASRIEVVRWLYANTPHQTKNNDMHAVVQRAMMNGDFEIAELLMPQGCKLGDYVGSLMKPSAIEGLLERGYLKEKKGAAAAIWISAREGNLDMMKRIAAQHPKPPRGKNSEWLQFWEYAINASCESGDVEMIKWIFDHPTGKLLHKQMKDDDIVDRFDELLPHAATGGHIEAMEYLLEQGFTDKYARAMVNAARKGHLKCIEWLLEHTYQYHPSGSADRVVLEAAKLGHLDILKFLHAPRYATEEMSTKRRKIEDTGAWWKRSREAMDEAATHGHLEVVKWLYANRSEGCTTAAMDGAAKNGHLEVVEWLGKITSEGCTAKAMENAAHNGHLKVVKWLHANRKEGCTVKVVENAIMSENLRVASWFRANSHSSFPNGTSSGRTPRTCLTRCCLFKRTTPKSSHWTLGAEPRVKLLMRSTAGVATS